MKVFRKVRQELLHRQGFNKYLAYAAGEILLVVAGILIALQIDNWNQNRKERELETVLLRELVVNLKNDLRDIEYNYAINLTSLNSNHIVLKFLEEERPYHDSLSVHFGHLVNGTIFANNVSTWESIKSIGIGIISNNQLRSEITALYSVMYEYLAKIENLHHQFGVNHLMPKMSEKFHTIGFFDRAVPRTGLNREGMKSLEEYLLFNLVWLNHQVTTYARMKKSITKLIGDIETELDGKD